MRDIRELKYFQSLPLERKIEMTAERIGGWYDHFNGNVAVSFSGGKDSTVLLDIARNHPLYGHKDINAVYVDTGLEYPEIRQFVKTFDNVDIIRPKMRFDEVIKKYGYPIISKNVSHGVAIARNTPAGLTAKELFNKDKKAVRTDRKYPFAVTLMMMFRSANREYFKNKRKEMANEKI